MVTEDLKREGYDKEEEYFHKLNRELIEKRRKELDLKKSQAPDRTQQPYWMICPKCGAKMSEADLSGIKVDKCPACGGIYFDSGELETLLQSKEPQGFFARMKRGLSTGI